MLLHLEIGGHAAFAVDPALEGDGAEVAGEIVTPGVVGAGEILDVAAVFESDQRAAMGAAVFERMNFSLCAAHDDDGHLADEGGAVVAFVGDIDIEGEVIPEWSFKNFLLFGA